MERDLQPGQLIARGVARHLAGLGHAVLTEFVPAPGMRVDVVALTDKGGLWVVECKSCRADFTSDHKWQGYTGYCDRFFWAVDADFPQELLPGGDGLIVGDGFDAEILRWGPEVPLPGARRKVLVQRFARTAARRLQVLSDPGASVAW
jgi:hypothetical protein